MFKPEVRHAVAQREQKMIFLIMPRTIERARLTHEVAVFVDFTLTDGEIFRTVGDDVEEVLRGNLRSKRDLSKETACDDRGIDQRFERYRLKMNDVSRARIL